MEQLKNIEECLVGFVQGQLGDLKKINAKELGEVIDAIHHLEEARYYCAVTEAMEKTKEEHSQGSTNISYYMENPNSNMRNYVPYMEYAPYMMQDKDWREQHLNYSDGRGETNGRSYYSRRMYMENRKLGDDQKSMKELEHYMKDLADDMTEMIEKSTPEEKQVLSNKLSMLANKVIK